MNVAPESMPLHAFHLMHSFSILRTVGGNCKSVNHWGFDKHIADRDMIHIGPSLSVVKLCLTTSDS